MSKMIGDYWAGQKRRKVYTTPDGKRFRQKENAIDYCIKHNLSESEIKESDE